jgi:hypothetical protein
MLSAPWPFPGRYCPPTPLHYSCVTDDMRRSRPRWVAHVLSKRTEAECTSHVFEFFALPPLRCCPLHPSLGEPDKHACRVGGILEATFHPRCRSSWVCVWVWLSPPLPDTEASSLRPARAIVAQVADRTPTHTPVPEVTSLRNQTKTHAVSWNQHGPCLGTLRPHRSKGGRSDPVALSTQGRPKSVLSCPTLGGASAAVRLSV